MNTSQLQITAFLSCLLLAGLAAGMIVVGGYDIELAVAIGSIGFVAKEAIGKHLNGNEKDKGGD